MTGSRRLTLGLALLLSCTALSGDEPKPSSAPAPAPLPRHYKKLGLDAAQVEKVRKTRADYEVKIDELKKQLQALQGEENSQLEKLLTDAQRRRLKELRDRGAGEFKIIGPKQIFKTPLGKATTFGVELTYDDAFEGDVTLTYPDLPKGMRIKPDPFVFKEGGSKIGDMTITVDKDVPAADYHFTIRATPEDGDPVEVTVKIQAY
jgi:hypothetical protein